MTEQIRVPQVGIWWDDGRRLVAVSVPTESVAAQAGVVDGPFNHVDEWPQYAAQFGMTSDSEYFTVPRGRVIFRSNGEAVILHGPSTSRSRLKRIAERFQLDRWGSLIDEHYFIGSDADELFREEDEDSVEDENTRDFKIEKSQKPKKRSSKPSITRRTDRDRRVRQNERIARVLSVLNLIQSRGRWNAATIAEELGCSQRTVYRDLGVLELAGVPYHFDAEAQSYRVRSDYRFPTLSLSQEEVFGQAAAGALATESGFEALQGITETNRKLAATSSDQVQELIADVSQIVAILNLQVAGDDRSRKIIETIRTAMINKKILTGIYGSPYEEEPVSLRLHPYRLCWLKRAWYVIGRPEDEAEPRTFRIVRFKTLLVTDDPAQAPDDFDLKTYLGNRGPSIGVTKTTRLNFSSIHPHHRSSLKPGGITPSRLSGTGMDV